METQLVFCTCCYQAFILHIVILFFPPCSSFLFYFNPRLCLDYAVCSSPDHRLFPVREFLPYDRISLQALMTLHLTCTRVRICLRDSLLRSYNWVVVTFQKVNDPKQTFHPIHTKKKWYTDHRINLLTWPSQSTDLNQIKTSGVNSRGEYTRESLGG